MRVAMVYLKDIDFNMIDQQYYMSEIVISFQIDEVRLYLLIFVFQMENINALQWSQF